mmetsp:Transcript_16906/g.35315  ORF Transcript_16906/g.35315 Transcript_16906/m.35315 type:complete len:284 (-) Transcript_16906:2186-3037(-)
MRNNRCGSNGNDNDNSRSYRNQIYTSSNGWSFRAGSGLSLGLGSGSKRSNSNHYPRCSFSSSTVLSAVVPELDDSFPDEYDQESSQSSSSSSWQQQADGFNGRFDDFEYESSSAPEEVLVNPFSFPMPTFSYSEYGNTLEQKRNQNNRNSGNANNNNGGLDGAPFTVPTSTLQETAWDPSPSDATSTTTSTSTTTTASSAPAKSEETTHTSSSNTTDKEIDGIDIGSRDIKNDSNTIQPAVEEHNERAATTATATATGWNLNYNTIESVTGSGLAWPGGIELN